VACHAKYDALYDAFGKAHLRRGQWILKQLEIAESSGSKIVKKHLSVSNQVFATCSNKFQQYLTDYGAITQRFGETYSKLAAEHSKRLDEALEFAKNSSPGIRNLVVQNAKLEMDARQTLFKLLGTMQDGLDVTHMGRTLEPRLGSSGPPNPRAGRCVGQSVTMPASRVRRGKS
jgi:hypothetical protein